MLGQGRVRAATLAALSLSSAFAPPSPVSVSPLLGAPAGASAASASFSRWRQRLIRHTALRGGGGGGGSRGGFSALPDSWLRREKLGVFSPYHQSRSSAGEAAGDARGGLGAASSSSESSDAASDGLNKLQKVLLACDVTFEDPSARVDAVELQATALLLDDLTADDLGVPPSALRSTKSILYTDVALSAKFTMCIFTLPAGATLPLHDHPGMTVLSKVLWGDLRVSAFDRAAPCGGADEADEGPAGGAAGRGVLSWLGSQVSADRSGGPAPFKVEIRREGEVWTADSGVKVTRPADGNLHEFTAVTPCCVVDVLAPPYDWQVGRRCTYYELQKGADGYWVRPIRCPSSFVTESRPFAGLDVNPPPSADV